MQVFDYNEFSHSMTKVFDEKENGIFVRHNTRISKNVAMYGPGIIGAHGHIRSSAYIWENVTIGDSI
jgi:UDP-3-O-[3-hydroxymyristoyl] glucosamine N-acyltransferase